MRKYVSDIKPRIEGQDQFGFLVVLGRDHYDSIIYRYYHLKPGEEMIVVTREILWGPDGSIRPLYVYRVYATTDGAFVERLRAATEEDLKVRD